MRTLTDGLRESVRTGKPVQYDTICDPCRAGTHDHSSRNVDMPGTFEGRLDHSDWCDCTAPHNPDDEP